jgi:acyl-CoA reductase-like NAD-dependent aldehyde dehydrogenase
MPEDKVSISQQEAQNAVEAAYLAFQAVAKFDQAKIDRICEAMANVALRAAARLGAMANEETGFGNAADKQEKNRFAAEDIWNYFKNLRTVGVIKETESVVEIASPRGVVAAIIPSTIRLRPPFSKSLSPSNRGTQSCFRRIRQPRVRLRKPRV